MRQPILPILLVWTSAVLALQRPEIPGRFDAMVVSNPTQGLDVATQPISSLPATDFTRAGWEGFKAAHGQDWSIYLDRRSGACP